MTDLTSTATGAACACPDLVFRAEAPAPGPARAAIDPGPVARILIFDRRLVGLHQTVGTGARRSPVQFHCFSALKPFGAGLFSNWNLEFLFAHFDHGVERKNEQVSFLQRLRQFLVALLQRVEVLFLGAGHLGRNEQARLDLTLIQAHLIAQRATVMDVQVRHDLARIFSTEEDTDCSSFSQLLTILEALEQVANVILHADSFE